MGGKAQKQYLNKIANRTAILISRKAREKAILAMDDDKEYHDKKFNLRMLGKEWKQLIKTENNG